MNRAKLLFFLLPFVLIFGLFQNCAPGNSLKFSENSSNNNSLGDNDGNDNGDGDQGTIDNYCELNGYTTEECQKISLQNFTKSYKTAPTDILFILDDSCSMNTIADSMASGFASIAKAHYPDNTRMALTYMAPAMLNSSGEIDFATPWHSKVPKESAGFLQLVTKSRIDNYVAKFPDHASSFPAQGCNSEWFSPDQTGADNISCIQAAAQLAPICTGVEAGLVTLEQTMKRLSTMSQRLFRKGAFVNIVLVSDTHEPGAGYFGRSGAPAQQKSFNELVAEIEKNSPGVASIKFSGILPIPVVGSPLYDGLKVIGNKPQDDDEAKINGEGFWDYSYLPYIKETSGVVAHAKTNDWSGVAASLIDDSKFTGSLVLVLDHPAIELLSVRLNGKDIDPMLWSLSPDKKTITVKHASTANETLNFSILYKHRK